MFVTRRIELCNLRHKVLHLEASEYLLCCVCDKTINTKGKMPSTYTRFFAIAPFLRFDNVTLSL